LAARSHHHDVVAIGASAGGVEALQRLVRDLPADLPAAVFVVLHIGRAETQLAEILNRAGPLPAAPATGGERFEPGRIYVAVPDRHLLLHDGHVLLRRGPHENMSRPAIDPLFRSAACSHGPRVVGVVLSGALNDGTAGLRAIKRCGGIALVQHPADAAVPSMPLSALHHVEVDECVPIGAMGEAIARYVMAAAGPKLEIPPEICLEAAIAAQEMSTEERKVGKLSPFSCPECGGSLWEVADGNLLRYRCHIGHAYTADAMLAAEKERTDQLLARLLRTHRDRAELVRRMARQERLRQNADLAQALLTRANEYEENAQVIQTLLRGRADTATDGAADSEV